ncbi:MAG: SCO family protein [Chitinophagales bacterium]|nr:SCO family protein [Bacteroidota bacterium]MCB9043037.1 SCO family protein [Chitinophagales bacterium]
MKKTKIIGLVILFIGVLFSFFFYYVFPKLHNYPAGTPQRSKVSRYYPISDDFQSENTVEVNGKLYHQIAPFSFIDQDSSIVTEKTIAGKMVVCDFFFTRCGGICPKLSKSLSRVQDRLKGEVDFMILSHTVDPAFDTPEVLKKYGETYHADFSIWKFLTGYDQKTFYAFVTQNYFVTAMPGSEGSAEIFDHTQKLVLFDAERVVRGYYDGTDSLAVNKLIHDMIILQIENKKEDKLEYNPSKKHSQQ